MVAETSPAAGRVPISAMRCFSGTVSQQPAVAITMLNINVETHDGALVARDMLGTKSRYIAKLFRSVDHVVYASSVEGGAQVCSAQTAKPLGTRCTVLSPARANLHPRQLEVIELGGGLVPVMPGNMNVLQARALELDQPQRSPGCAGGCFPA
jgi:hypothetical protein